MIFLDRMTEGDLPLILKWKRQEHYLNGKLNLQYNNLTMDSQKIWFRNIKDNKKCIYWIIKSGTIKIGIADINHINYEEKRCDLECVIGDYHFKDRGIKEVVLYNLYEYAFDKLNMKLVCRKIQTDSKYEYSFEKKKVEKSDMPVNKYDSMKDRRYININNDEWKNIKNEYFIEKIQIDN